MLIPFAQTYTLIDIMFKGNTQIDSGAQLMVAAIKLKQWLTIYANTNNVSFPYTRGIVLVTQLRNTLIT